MFVQRSHAAPVSKAQGVQRHGKNRNSRFFQAKLRVNAPGDEYEQEADVVADKVMRMTASDISPAGKQHGESPVLQRTLLSGIPGLQRKCAECEQEENEQVQRKETGASSATAPSIVSSVLNSGGGRPLDKGARQFMESRFGQDFGQVRIHTDSKAAESAEAIQARAYTSGKDVVFGQGEYQPESESGKRLLAHELAHVGQQNKHLSVPTKFENGNSSQPNLFLKRAPSARESVGGSAGNYTFLQGPKGEEEKTLTIGDKGFSQRALGQIPQKAAVAISNLTAYHLDPVEIPPFKWYDLEVMRLNHKANAYKKKKGWGNPPSIDKYLDRSAASSRELADRRALEKYEANTICSMFNNWVPRANLTFISLSKLEGLQEILGIYDLEGMSKAVIESLDQAQGIAERAQVHYPGSIDVPAANSQVSSDIAAVNVASKQMRSAWIGFQKVVLTAKDVDRLQKMGITDEKRLAEINQVIETWTSIGKTIDFSLSLMEGGKKLVQASSTEEFGGAAKSLGKEFAKGISSSGINIPTDVGGLFGGAVYLVHYAEIEKIEAKLKMLKGSIQSHQAAASALGIQEKISAFESAYEHYKLKSNDLQKSIIARQLAYLKFGEQIDNAARKDVLARSKGMAPGGKEERFATVFLLTSTLREVLAVNRGARASYHSPSEVWTILNDLAIVRYNGYFSSTRSFEHELEPLASIYKQVRSFSKFSEYLNTLLDPIDAKAVSVMQALSGGAEQAGAY